MVKNLLSSASALNEIKAFIHCGLCLAEWKGSTKISSKLSPRDYSKLEAGWTKLGLQLWCKRHECNIMHIDFEGIAHPANTTRQLSKKEMK